VGVGKVEGAHIAEVVGGEAAPEACGEVGGQALEELNAIAGAGVAALLDLDQPAADLLVGDGHDGVDAAGSGATGGVQECGDIGEDGVVVRRIVRRDG